MPTNILISPPPYSVEINGKGYLINSDYRVFVHFELLMQDNSVPDDDKLAQSLCEFYRGHIPTDIDAAADAMIRFYIRDKEIKPQNEGDACKHGDKMIYSYEHDGDAIYAAFRQCYGINLTNAKTLHWWEFKALLENLPPECEFMRAVSYRSMKIDGKLPPEEQKRLRKLKEFYALPDNRTTAEKERDFTNDLAAMF